MALGPAGTGKSFLAVSVAMTMLFEKKVEKVILSRPAVEAGEKLGFLPGDMREKVELDRYDKCLWKADVKWCSMLCTMQQQDTAMFECGYFQLSRVR